MRPILSRRNGLMAAAALATFVMASVGGAERAEAQRRLSIGFSYGPSYGYYGTPLGYGYGGYYPQFQLQRRAPVYHGPSVHYDSYYHPEYYHWTPGQGVHSHGHYDVVPHYVPGHVDRWHGNHIDLNPHYHGHH
jgi:hypothetical protein